MFRQSDRVRKSNNKQNMHKRMDTKINHESRIIRRFINNILRQIMTRLFQEALEDNISLQTTQARKHRTNIHLRLLKTASLFIPSTLEHLESD